MLFPTLHGSQGIGVSAESREAMERRMMEATLPAFRHMNEVLDAYNAGNVTYEEYREAWDAFESLAAELRAQ